MGGIAILNKDDCSAFTGGIPKHDWSGLKTPTNDYVSPNQLRTSHASSKSYNYRKRRDWKLSSRRETTYRLSSEK